MSKRKHILICNTGSKNCSPIFRGKPPGREIKLEFTGQEFTESQFFILLTGGLLSTDMPCSISAHWPSLSRTVLEWPNRAFTTWLLKAFEVVKKKKSLAVFNSIF